MEKENALGDTAGAVMNGLVVRAVNDGNVRISCRCEHTKAAKMVLESR